MDYFTKKFMTTANGAHRRAVYKSMGYTDLDLSQPLVAVANSWGEVCPGHYGLDKIAEKVKEGLWQKGLTPFEFNTISQCATLTLGLDGVRYDLATRDLVAFDIETVINLQMFDGIVFLPTCDKIVPGMLMAAARLNIPSIFVLGGVMGTGKLDGNTIDLSDLDEKIMGAYIAGKISLSEIKNMEENACPTWGACPLMGTANTMQCLTEVLGMALPGSSTLPANSSIILRRAKEAGNLMYKIIKNKILPRNILSVKAMKNMITMLMAIGGSTNSIVHILALAEELDLGGQINLDLIDQISKNTPCLLNVKPNGPYYVNDFAQSGGVPQLMYEIKDKLFLDIPSINGKSVKENIEEKRNAKVNREVIRNLKNPLSKDGGIVVLYGNIAPGGAILRQSACYRENLVHRGPAKVFNSKNEAIEAIKGRKIKPKDVVVVRYEGPKGGPGMPDIYAILAMICGMGLDKDVAVITDARFSGFARGFGVCQINPEAADNGPLAYLENDDEILIDIPNRKLEVLNNEIFKKREKSINPKNNKKYKGILQLYQKLGKPANKGAGLV